MWLAWEQAAAQPWVATAHTERAGSATGSPCEQPLAAPDACCAAPEQQRGQSHVSVARSNLPCRTTAGRREAGHNVSSGIQDVELLWQLQQPQALVYCEPRLHRPVHIVALLAGEACHDVQRPGGGHKPGAAAALQAGAGGEASGAARQAFGR